MKNLKLSESFKYLKEATLSKNIVYPSAGLLSGRMGAIVFLYELTKNDDDPDIRMRLSNEVSLLQDTLRKGLRLYSLHSGIAGVYWAKHYLKYDSSGLWNLFDDEEREGLILKRTLGKLLLTNDFDYLHGVSGILKAVACSNLLSVEESNLILDHIKKNLIKTSNGFSWENHFFKADSSAYCTGFAHGIAGLIKTLEYLPTSLKYDLIRDLVQDLYRRYVTFNPFGNGSYKCKSHILGWCNSRFSDGLVLLYFLKLFDQETERELVWKSLLEQLAAFMTVRSALSDFCLCHGAGGLILMLHTLQISNPYVLINESLTCVLDETLNGLSIHISAYNQGMFPDQDYSLLTGLSGLGLALLHIRKRNDFLLNIMNLT